MTARFALLSLALATTPLVAQTPPCASMNDATNAVSNAITSSGFSGPNVWAWQYTPSQNLTVAAATMFTTNNFVAQSLGLEIWSDDPATSLPKARLGGGFWKIAKTTVNSWQGTNMDKPVALASGTSYWIVWNDPGFSTVPTDPAGTTLPFARQSGTTWTSATATALKFRLYCSQLDQQGVTVKGAACFNTAGLGTAFVNQAPTIGNGAFMVEGTGFPALASGLLLLGAIPSWPSLPIPGADPTCLVHTDILLTVSGTAGNGNVRNAAGATGQFTFGIPIPADPALVGGVVSTQIGAVDTASTFPLKIVTSNALLLTLY